ncbi:hypothetical protein BH18GEM1_BH18GEM1_17280 [soil metagenome]
MLRSIVTTLLIGAIAACASRTDSDVAVTTEMGARGDIVTDTTAAAAPLAAWQIALEPNEGFDIAGEGRVNALPGGKTRAAVEIRGADAGAQHPWHIHEGECGSDGAIVGDPAAYPVLTANADGEASADATIDVALDADPDGDYYVNIHKSPTEADIIVSCAELSGTY